MKLDFEQIKSVTRGAVKIWQENDVINFAKCTDKQVDAWYKYGNDVLGYRAKTTTGIRLDFYTDSKFFAFKSATGSRFDIHVDGLLRKTCVNDDGGFIEEKINLTNPIGKEKSEARVTLVFPSHNIGSLEYVEIDDGAYMRVPEYKTKILFIGDSITQGHNSKCDSLSYAWRTVNFFDADAIINGIGGAFYMPESFDIPDFDPDVVILAYGTNDASRSDYDTMKANATAYLDSVKEVYGDKKVVVTSPIWRATAEGAFKGEDFENKRNMIEEEASARGFYVISGLKLVPPLPEFYADKYLHPNALGFGVYAENLIKELLPIINKI